VHASDDPVPSVAASEPHGTSAATSDAARTTVTSEPHGTTAAASDATLDALREEVETIDALPVADRVAVFERVNATLADELAVLDEV
jgi:hypothetical protein